MGGAFWNDAVRTCWDSCCECRYKVDTSPARNTTYSQAIIAVPKYPPAEELDELLKVQLIFDKFVDEHKDHLSAKNYFALLHRVKGSNTEVVRICLPSTVAKCLHICVQVSTAHGA